MSADAPEGYERIWVPTREVPHGRRWELVAPETSRPCRFTVGPNRASCKRPSVARLNRSSFKDRVNWWHYCEEHLFGKRIRGGQLETRVLVEVPDGR